LLRWTDWLRTDVGARLIDGALLTRSGGSFSPERFIQHAEFRQDINSARDC